MRAFIKIVLLVPLFSLVSCRSVPYFSNDAELADPEQDKDEQNSQDPLLYLRLNSELDQDSDDSNSVDDEKEAKSRFVSDLDGIRDETGSLDDILNDDDGDDELLRSRTNSLQSPDESRVENPDEREDNGFENSKYFDLSEKTEQDASEID